MPGAGTEGRISRCCSSPRGGGWTVFVALFVYECACLCLRNHKVNCTHECVHSVCVIMHLSASSLETCCLVYVHALVDACVLQHLQSARGGSTYKRHLPRRAKTTKVTLPPVMCAVYSLCSDAKYMIGCVQMCDFCWQFLCLYVCGS